jgi:hypothetical protein
VIEGWLEGLMQSLGKKDSRLELRRLDRYLCGGLDAVNSSYLCESMFAHYRDRNVLILVTGMYA